MRFVIILVVLAVCHFPAWSYGAEIKSVSLATLTDFVPFCFRKEGAVTIADELILPGSDSVQLQGYSWDVVRESFHAGGYAIRLHIVPWERGVHYLNTAKVMAIFPANKTIKREEEYIFSEGIVDQMRMMIYLPSASTLVWQGLESMNDLRVASVRGWSYGERWEKNQEIIKEQTDSILQGFRLLDKDRLAGVVGYEAAYDYALKQERISHKYRKVGPYEVISEYLMGRRGNPDSAVALQAFDQGWLQIRANGKLREIGEKWQ
jgi:ABC-type amino acid transport substrate-binding protein